MSAGLSIHDDILDKSNEKHSRETILGKYGLDNSLLVGDLIILKSWIMLIDISNSISKPRKIVNIMKEYIAEMCEAQLMEVSFRHNISTDLEFYKKLLSKLNADLKACAKIGAILGGGSDEEIEAFGNFGKNLGFLMAIRDDLRDTREKFCLFHRIKYESIPLPLLYSIKTMQNQKIINNLIQKSSFEDSDFQRLNNVFKDTKAFDYIQNLSKEIAEQAKNELKIIHPSNAKTGLKYLVELILKDIIILWPP
jgi:geranylgeranyl pyrophosphate synthase